ncbi:MAG: hypothetical protein WAT09_06775 [Paracoccaceae bacterium]
MLQLCRFVPGLAYRLKLDPGGSVSLIGENGVDILFYAQFRVDAGEAGHIVLNSAIDRQWQAEQALPLAPRPVSEPPQKPLPCDIVLRFAGSVLEVQLDGIWHPFDRFDQKRCSAVAFVRLHWAHDPDAALIWRGETLDAALIGIEAHLLHRRMDDLDRRMGARDDR